MDTFGNVMRLWGSVEAFADDLGIPVTAAWAWHTRGRIPAEWFLRIVRAAEVRGLHGVSLDLLATLAEQRPRAKSSDRTPSPAEQAA